jgi:D-beta-D-heptose 7-phosphate kinase/D-beta-D-heptose 1-phosphate adenosyltransferase
LCRKLAARMALVTLDRDGMMLVERNGYGEHFPTHARGVYDITGAGDMVMAMVGLCLAAGASADDAVRLSNVAAGLEVERTGAAAVYRDEIRAAILAATHSGGAKIITREQAARLAQEHRQRGEKVVFTNGCFDLLHVGHVTYLADAARLGDVLMVAVNSDHSVRRLKGPNRPVIGQADRAAMLAALGCVRYVIEFDDDTPCRLLEAIRPDVLVKGGTYEPHEVVGHEIVKAYGGQVCVAGLVEGISTTNILASLPHGGPAALADQKLRVVPPPDETPPSKQPWRRAG